MIRLICLGGVALALAACAPKRPSYPYYPDYNGGGYNYDPTVDMHVDTNSGRVHPSVGANLGPLRVAASPNGGRVGTRFGMFGISAGF